jgi:hypothetical protein
MPPGTSKAVPPDGYGLIKLAGEETVTGSVTLVAVGEEVLVQGVVLGWVERSGHGCRRGRSHVDYRYYD